MKTKHLVIMALFVGIGAILHMIVPGFGAGGMKPDFSLLMMFLGILLFPNMQSALLIGLATGIISGLTTTFPGGLFPNIIDKLITALLFYGLYLLVKKNRHVISNTILTAVGTIISGTVFLLSAYLIVGLPDSLALLFGITVIPAAIINAVAMIIVYPIVISIAKRSNLILT
jgi:hypothetical protein